MGDKHKDNLKLLKNDFKHNIDLYNKLDIHDIVYKIDKSKSIRNFKYYLNIFNKSLPAALSHVDKTILICQNFKLFAENYNFSNPYKKILSSHYKKLLSDKYILNLLSIKYNLIKNNCDIFNFKKCKVNITEHNVVIKKSFNSKEKLSREEYVKLINM